MEHWLHFLDGVRPVSGQIFPRSTQSAPLIIINSTSDFGEPPDDAAITPGTLEFLKVLFDQPEQTIIPPAGNDTFSTSSWAASSTAANVPKNAVLLDSFLLKTRPRPTSPATSTDATSTTSIIINTTHNSFEERQAKRQQTGRPNFFYLGSGVNGDSASWSDFDTEAEQEASNGWKKGTSPAPMNIISTRLPFPFMSVTNLTTTLPPFTRRPSLTSSSDASAIPPRTSSVNNGPSIMTSRFTVRDPSDIPPPFARPPATNDQTSDNVNVLTNTKEKLPASFYGSPPADDQPRLRPSGNAEDASEQTRRRQGSVFSAPSPVQPSPGREDNAVRIRGRPEYGQGNPLTGQGGRVGPRPALDSDPRIKTAFDMDASAPVPVEAQDDGGIKLETCRLGGDSTCNQAAYEVCRNDDGATTCTCKLGTGRQHLRDTCQSMLTAKEN